MPCTLSAPATIVVTASVPGEAPLAVSIVVVAAAVEAATTIISVETVEITRIAPTMRTEIIEATAITTTGNGKKRRLQRTTLMMKTMMV